MQRTKTDLQDSLVIAQFCAKHQPSAWEPQHRTTHLRALVRLRRRSDSEPGAAPQSVLIDATDAVVTTILQQVLTMLEAIAVNQRIDDHIRTHQTIHGRQLLTSLKGIGVVTATLILAEMTNLATYPSAKAAAANLGVTPSHYRVGHLSPPPAMSKMGKSDVRAALYFPALTAKRWCPEIRAGAERLAARGKPKRFLLAP